MSVKRMAYAGSLAPKLLLEHVGPYLSWFDSSEGVPPAKFLAALFDSPEVLLKSIFIPQWEVLYRLALQDMKNVDSFDAVVSLAGNPERSELVVPADGFGLLHNYVRWQNTVDSTDVIYKAEKRYGLAGGYITESNALRFRLLKMVRPLQGWAAELASEDSEWWDGGSEKAFVSPAVRVASSSDYSFTETYYSVRGAVEGIVEMLALASVLEDDDQLTEAVLGELGWSLSRHFEVMLELETMVNSREEAGESFDFVAQFKKLRLTA